MTNNQKKQRLSRMEAKAQTRQDLLTAAGIEFAQQGFHGTSIDRIAEQAGYTKGAVYTHFSSKEALYLDLLHAHLAKTEHTFESLMASGKPVAFVIDELSKNYFSELEKNRDWAILTVEFFIHAMRHQDIKLQLVNKIRTAQKNIETALVNRLNHSNEALPMTIEQTALALLSFNNGIDLLSLIDPQQALPNVYQSVLKLLLTKLD
ncbi:transcriptional regulator, TetR family [Amphibacillus marinus]|uniref:Transcriptional regulator, TetR family n=1 Tax=Amphibacillus marinus TaxID=872970 RepID=A0A1H8Q6I3_9BACI|nr:TetR/AcrR family transcriptional regulator [Amphibacillus marinus]SEO49524.1 transcriptional regulator, TetR family [Amphibacillus marinus]